MQPAAEATGFVAAIDSLRQARLFPRPGQELLGREALRRLR